MDRSGFEPDASCLQSPKTLPPASKYSKELRKWMDQKGFSQGYRNDILRYLKPTENKEIQGITELREIVSGSSSSMALTVFRAYINFLLDTEIITEEDAIYFRKALPSRKTSVDGYVPTDQDVKNAYQKIKKEKDRILFGILAFSGIRITELVKMLKEFDPSRLINDEKTSKYPPELQQGKQEIPIGLHALRSGQKTSQILHQQGYSVKRFTAIWCSPKIPPEVVLQIPHIEQCS